MARKRKPRIVQLDIFKENDNEKLRIESDAYWQLFKPIVDKLNKTNSSICEDWWRSRYSEMLYKGNTESKTNEEFNYRKKGMECWKFIWTNNTYYNYMIKDFWKGKPYEQIKKTYVV